MWCVSFDGVHLRAGHICNSVINVIMSLLLERDGASDDISVSFTDTSIGTI